MGSLPNLHELGSTKINIPVHNEELARAIREHNRTLKYDESNNNNYECITINENSNAGAHKPVKFTRSLGSNPHEIIKRKNSSQKFIPSSRLSRNLRSKSVIPFQFPHNTISESGGDIKRISRQASVSNSMGGSSVHKLISVIKSTQPQCGPVYSRTSVWQNLITLCLINGMFTIAYIPIIILQSSVSSWWLSSQELLSPTTSSTKIKNIHNSANIGSLLLSGLYLIGAISAIVSPFTSYRIGITRCLTYSFLGTTIFTLIHLYPSLYLLIPGYIIMGISIANMNYTKTSYMIILASKLKFVLNEQEQHELRNKSETTRKEMLTIKLYGWISLARNIGLVIGGILTYFLILITKSTENPIGENLIEKIFINKNSKYDDKVCGYDSCRLEFLSSNIFAMPDDENLIRNLNSLILPCKTSTMLAAVYVGFATVATAVSIFIHRTGIQHQYNQFHRLKFSNILHTTCETLRYKKLQLMIPLMIFIGIEQGFMYADFSKLYVICVMGIETTPLIFISLGLLQSIAAITLSLLLNHIKRYYIVGVGFIFQACLLLSLIMWKPKTDDVGLFYVISSAWGVCNAIWETIAFCLLLALFPDCWEFPFAHCYFFRYLGLSIAFAYHEQLCTSVKLYVMSVMLLISVIPYIWIEMQLMRIPNKVINRISSVSR